VAVNVLKVRFAANRFQLSDVVCYVIDQSTDTFVDGLITEFYHIVFVPY